MIVKRGNMWDAVNDKCSHFCFTTNACVKTDGRLVMGKGIAKKVGDMFPDIPVKLGRAINHLVLYGIKHAGYYKINGHSVLMTAFQVKGSWKQPADLQLIEYSALLLKKVAELPGLKSKVILLNFPGIGNGGLAKETVLPYLQVLPDNVHIYLRGK